MSVTLAPYGQDVYQALTKAVAEAKQDDPLAEVMLVVPTEAIGTAARRWLAAHGPSGSPGIAGLSIVTLYRLAERIAAQKLAGGGRRPVTAPVLVGAMRAIVSSTDTCFSPVADHPQTARALADASAELNRLDPAVLPTLAGGREVTAEVIALHELVRNHLASGYFDEVELMRTATEMVDELAPVILFLPHELTPAEQQFVSAVAGVAPVSAIVGVTGSAADDRVVRSVAGALGDPAASVPATSQVVGTRVICTTDADDEVRAVLGAVAEQLRAGVPGHRIGVVYPTANPYARLLHEHLAAASIECYGRGVKPDAEMVYGRAVRGLLALPDRDFRRAEVMSWLADARPAGIDAQRADRISRRAGIVSGADWDLRLTDFAGDQRLRADSEEDEGYAQWRQQQADFAEAVRDFVRELRMDLDGLDTAASWTELADRFDALWTRLFPEPSKDPEQARVYDSIHGFVRGLQGLDEVTGGPSLNILRETLELELRHSTSRVGKIGTGVMVGPIRDAVGMQFDLLCVVGMAEGTLPPATTDDPLLPEAVRARTGGVLPTWRDRQDLQHRDLLAALSGAGTSVLSFPRGDIRSGAKKVPSRWLLPTLQAYMGPDVRATTWEDFSHRAVEVRGSYAAGVESEAPVSVVALRQRQALCDPMQVDPTARAMIQDRADAVFSRFTGLVGNQPALPEIGPSPTRLQKWFECPHHYFQQYILGLREEDDPDETVEMSPLDEGTLLHEVLERLVSKWRDPDFGQPWPEDMVSELDKIVSEVFSEAEKSMLTGLRIPWERTMDKLRADLRAWISRDDALRAGRWKPLATELHFDNLDVPLPDGTTLRLQGSVDRVDIDAAGNLHVLDYKSGKSNKYDPLCEEDPTCKGRFLQLPLYALAAQRDLGRGPEPTRADYWFISAGQKGKTVGYDVTDDVLDLALKVIQVAVDGHRQGLFPPRPVRHAGAWGCPSCHADVETDRYEDEWFEKLITDARLAAYRGVIS